MESVVASPVVIWFGNSLVCTWLGCHAVAVDLVILRVLSWMARLVVVAGVLALTPLVVLEGRVTVAVAAVAEASPLVV